MYADNLPLVPDDPGIYAYIIDPESGEHFDTTYSMEATESYVLASGFIAVAVQDQPRYPNLYASGEDTEILTTEVLQAAFDHWREMYLDYWGI